VKRDVTMQRGFLSEQAISRGRRRGGAQDGASTRGHCLPLIRELVARDQRLVRPTTNNPLYADDRNFHKVESWTKDGTKVDRLLYAGNNLEKARDVFANAIKHRPRISRLTIRQRTRALFQWPEE